MTKKIELEDEVLQKLKMLKDEYLNESDSDIVSHLIHEHNVKKANYPPAYNLKKMSVGEIETILKMKVYNISKKRRTDHGQSMMDAYEEVLKMIDTGEQ